jgi:hypothetical protein
MQRLDVSTPPGEKCIQCPSRFIGVSTRSIRRSLREPLCTFMRSNARQTLAPSLRFVLNTALRLGLYAMITVLSMFTLPGCYLSRTIDQATADDVNNRSFTFENGAVFHTALTNVSTTLSFTNNAANFTLSSAGGMATGTNRFDSCILTVATSTYAATAGPQVNDVITLDPCDFNSDRETLMVSRGSTTATSMVATAIGAASGTNANQATANNVNNQSFTFASGEVFHSALINLSTVLSFSDSATNFTLSSVGGMATGTNRFSSCILTVTRSDFNIGDGPQANSVITLSPCTFGSNNKTLTVSNGSVTATSAPGTVTVP